MTLSKFLKQTQEESVEEPEEKEPEEEVDEEEENDISIKDIYRQIKSISERLDKYDEIRENASKGWWFGYLLMILMVMIAIVLVPIIILG